MIRCAVVAIAITLAAGAVRADEPPADTRPIVRVKTADELLRAIAPMVIIEVEPGEYEVSEVKPFDSRWVEFVTAARGVDAGRQDVGHEIKIKELEGLTIRAADPEKPPRLLARPRFALVFDIADSSRVELRRLVLGHTHEGICSSGVIAVTNSVSVSLVDCELFGCGYEGFVFRDSIDLTVRGCRVYDCKGALAEIFACQGVQIIDTTFDKNVNVYDGIRIRRAKGVVFDRCVFADNTTQVGGRATLFDVDAKSGPVHVRNAIIRNNKFRQITNDSEKVIVETAT